jgi:hypothetical protein
MDVGDMNTVPPYKLTPWWTVYLEEFIVAQPFQIFPEI